VNTTACDSAWRRPFCGVLLAALFAIAANAANAPYVP
jgi:hypothetical protein